MPLELLALLALGAILLRALDARTALDTRFKLLLVLASTPLVIAAVQLLPLLPTPAWLKLPGRAEFSGVLDLASGGGDWRALSVAPRATAASLLAGLPLAAALLLGFTCTLDQLRAFLKIVVAVAVLQVAVGALQLGAGDGFLLFGAISAPPRRHLRQPEPLRQLPCRRAVLLDLARVGRARGPPPHPGLLAAFALNRNATKLMVAVLLVLALLISRSRAAVVIGLSGALVGLAMTQLVRSETPRFWRWVPAAAIASLVLLVFLIGADAVTSRFTHEDVAEAAGYRVELARTSFDAAAAFFPFGSGWGTYDLVYPRFQPSSLSKFINHAHMDYVELLVEGGVLFLASAALVASMLARRVAVLWRIVAHGHRASRDSVAAVFCGLGLTVVLLHAVVDFNLRIPALAIVACLLAGAFLRPLPAHSVRR